MPMPSGLPIENADRQRLTTSSNHVKDTNKLEDRHQGNTKSEKSNASDYESSRAEDNVGPVASTPNAASGA